MWELTDVYRQTTVWLTHREDKHYMYNASRNHTIRCYIKEKRKSERERFWVQPMQSNYDLRPLMTEWLLLLLDSRGMVVRLRCVGLKQLRVTPLEYLHPVSWCCFPLFSLSLSTFLWNLCQLSFSQFPTPPYIITATTIRVCNLHYRTASRSYKGGDGILRAIIKESITHTHTHTRSLSFSLVVCCVSSSSIVFTNRISKPCFLSVNSLLFHRYFNEWDVLTVLKTSKVEALINRKMQGDTLCKGGVKHSTMNLLVVLAVRGFILFLIIRYIYINISFVTLYYSSFLRTEIAVINLSR